MAADRDQRQLMRQRGAGSRDVNNIDFALKFGSHGSRNERQLMRSRGAGNRKIDNVDFGFAFPTPGHNRRSAGKTPQSNRKTVPRLSKTPGNRASIEPSATRSRRQSSASARRQSSASRQVSHTPPPVQDDQDLQIKRQRVDTNDSSIPRRTSRRRQTSGAVFAIAEEPENDEHVVGITNNNVVPDSPMVLLDDGDKENQDATTDISKAPPRQNRKSSLQNSASQRTRSSLQALGNSIASSIEEHETAAPIRESHTKDSQRDDNEINAGHAPDFYRPASKGADPKPTKRRRKRKTVVLGRRKRRSSGMDSMRSTSLVMEEASKETPLAEPAVEPAEESAALFDTNETHEARDHIEVSLIDNVHIRSRPKRSKRRGRLSVSSSPVPQGSEDEDEDATYNDEEHTPDPTTPAVKRRGTSKRKSISHERPAGVKRRKNNSGSTFPILTHRMTNLHALPTIIEEETEQQSEHERLILDHFKDRTTPNAVDVLAQICRETIETAVEQINTQSSRAAGRFEVNAKRIAIQAYGKELDQRLFDMSEAVEYRFTLEARLRKSRREKADLQAQWMDIRRQRDELGLRADAIRRQNWENEEKSRQQWEASKLAEQIELSLETEPAEEDLEFMIRTLAGEVSNASNGCSVLNTVKAFNARLEQVAVLLESK